MKLKLLIILTFAFSLRALCQSDMPSYILLEVSEDPSYGYTEENPVKVGYGPKGERYYLAQLTGKKGGPIKIKRLGSCCPFETDSPNAIEGRGGMLDRYKIKAKGSKAVVIYLNMYDYEYPKAIKNYYINN